MKSYVSYNNKSLRHPKNKEFVTARINIINKKKVVRISIGLIVCEVLELKKNDRIQLFLNKDDRNLILIKKSFSITENSYKLNWNGNNNSFMTFDFRYETSDSFRLSQTIILDYETNENRFLVINLEKIKWNN